MSTKNPNAKRTFAVAALALPLALQATPGAGAPDDVEEQAASEPVARYEGTLAEGLAELEARAQKQQYDAALELSEALLAPTGFTRWRRELEREGSKVLLPAIELADPLLERFGLNGYPEPLRAEVHYAVGLVRREEEAREAAEEAFGRALSLAGPGELRLDSMYNRGQTALEEGESWRAQVPEISGQQPGQPAPAPVMTAPPPGGAASGAQAPYAQQTAGGPSEEPDPLELARTAYLRAKEQLVERLRADWRDADTRANVELIQRRLKELDEIERQREEQQQEEQQQEQQQQDQQQDPDQQDQGQGSDEDRQDQQQDEEQQQDDQPEEPPAPEEQQQDEQQEQQPEEGEAEQPEEQEAEQEPEGEPQEVYLTREEIQRLLEQLRQHEEEGEMVRERLAREMQERVERDW